MKHILLQHFGNVEISSKGPDGVIWQARAMRKILTSNEGVTPGRENGLQFLLQNRHNFTLLDVDSLQIAKSVHISDVANKCIKLTVTRDGGWSLFGMRTKSENGFVVLTNNFCEIKSIHARRGMHYDLSELDETPSIFQIIRESWLNFVGKLTGVRKNVWYLRRKTFPHISASSDGLALLCVMEASECFLWRCRKSSECVHINQCPSDNIPGHWCRIHVDNVYLDEWLRDKSTFCIESQIYFNKCHEIKGGIVYISRRGLWVYIIHGGMETDSDALLFSLSTATVDLNHSNQKGNNYLPHEVCYLTRLSSNGNNLAIGVNALKDTYLLVVEFPSNETCYLKLGEPSHLCSHSETGLPFYELNNYKYCWIVDIQWLGNDLFFAVMTHCGSLTIFDRNAKLTVVSLMDPNVYTAPGTHHQIFQRSYFPQPQPKYFSAVRPPKDEYWDNLRFSMLWSSEQNVLACSSGRTIALFSIAHFQDLEIPRETISQDANEMQSHRKSESGDKLSETNTADLIQNVDLKENTDLLKQDTLDTFINNVNMPEIIIRPAVVEIHPKKYPNVLPITFKYSDHAVSTTTLGPDNILPCRSSESTSTIVNELFRRPSQSLPDIHSPYDFLNGNLADDEASLSDVKSESKNHFTENVHTPPFTASVGSLGSPETEQTRTPMVIGLQMPGVPEMEFVCPKRSEMKQISNDVIKESINHDVSTQMPSDGDASENHRKRLRPVCIITPSASVLSYKSFGFKLQTSGSNSDNAGSKSEVPIIRPLPLFGLKSSVLSEVHGVRDHYPPSSEELSVQNSDREDLVAEEKHNDPECLNTVENEEESLPDANRIETKTTELNENEIDETKPEVRVESKDNEYSDSEETPKHTEQLSDTSCPIVHIKVPKRRKGRLERAKEEEERLVAQIKLKLSSILSDRKFVPSDNFLNTNQGVTKFVWRNEPTEEVQESNTSPSSGNILQPLVSKRQRTPSPRSIIRSVKDRNSEALVRGPEERKDSVFKNPSNLPSTSASYSNKSKPLKVDSSTFQGGSKVLPTGSCNTISVDNSASTTTSTLVGAATKLNEVKPSPSIEIKKESSFPRNSNRTPTPSQQTATPLIKPVIKNKKTASLSTSPVRKYGNNNQKYTFSSKEIGKSKNNNSITQLPRINTAISQRLSQMIITDQVNYNIITKAGRIIRSSSSGSSRSGRRSKSRSRSPLSKSKYTTETETYVHGSHNSNISTSSAETVSRHRVPPINVENSSPTIESSIKVLQGGSRLRIRDEDEEDVEAIPLHSIILKSKTGSSGKCSRRVSFCDPIALYKTMSPQDLREEESEDENDNNNYNDTSPDAR